MMNISSLVDFFFYSLTRLSDSCSSVFLIASLSPTTGEALGAAAATASGSGRKATRTESQTAASILSGVFGGGTIASPSNATPSPRGAVVVGKSPRIGAASPNSGLNTTNSGGGGGQISSSEREQPKGQYVCRYPGCGKTFVQAGALHTHTGWHKRNLNIKNGVYDRLSHRLKETHSVIDKAGRITSVEVYRCDFPKCGKHFQSRGALQTHLGWHKRQPKGAAATFAAEHVSTVMQ